MFIWLVMLYQCKNQTIFFIYWETLKADKVMAIKLSDALKTSEK